MNSLTLICKRLIFVPKIQRNVLNNTNLLTQTAAFSFKYNLYAPDKAELPKRPLSAYMIFVKTNYGKTLQEVPKDQKLTQIFKTLGTKWKELNLAEKQVYLEKAEENSKKYKDDIKEFYRKMKPEEIQKFNNKLKNEKIQKKQRLKKIRMRRENKESQKPKKPPGAFFLYLKTLDRGEAKVYDFVQAAGTKWKMLPQEDKQKYYDEAKKQMDEYEKKLATWEGKMILEGKTKLTRKKTLKKIKKSTATRKVEAAKKKAPKGTKKPTKKTAKKSTKKAAKNVRKRQTVEKEKSKAEVKETEQIQEKK